MKEVIPEMQERILVLAPSGQDAVLACSVLEKEGFKTCICKAMADLCSEYPRGAGVLLISEEALHTEAVNCLKELLIHQEPWSDIPMTILTLRSNERKGLDIMNVFGLDANINLLERTFKPVTLVSVMRVALRARRRQYEVRDLLLQLQQSAEDLKRSNQELEQFAYVSSHDLQEPLRTITSYADLLLLRKKEMLDQEAAKYLDFMQEGALHAQDLIRGLLGYASITKQDYVLEKNDLNQLLKSALAHLKSSIEEAGAVVTADELPTLFVSKLQITQLFQNLISNGIKYCEGKKPKVHVGVKQEKNRYVFSVADNGIGIAPEHQERVFMIFKRLHSKSEYPGTGIGLAVCKKIVQQHQGEIWLESEPKKGSTFFFSLPQLKGADYGRRA